MEQNRLQSKVLWVAIFAVVGFVLGNWGLYDKLGMTSESYKQLVDLLLAALAAFGIFNNPVNKTGL